LENGYLILDIVEKDFDLIELISLPIPLFFFFFIVHLKGIGNN